MKTQLLSKKRWEVKAHQVITQEELRKITRVNYLAKEEAIKTGKRTPVLDWMIWNVSCWGLRICESMFLTCGEIHLGSTFAHIQLEHTKGKKPRDIFIGPTFAQILKDYLKWKKAIGEPTDAQAPFFLSRNCNKTWMSDEGLRKAFKRAIYRAYPKKHNTPHSGRHTFASILAPLDLRAVQRFLGHSSIATTEIYVHVLDSQMQNLAQIYDSLMYSSIQEKPK